MPQDMTFDCNDLLDQQAFAQNLKTYCEAAYPYTDTDGSFVVSLNAEFGRGKTHFLQMFKTMLQEDSHDVIYMNVWRDDFYNEPIISILSEIIIHARKSNEKDGIIGQLENCMEEILKYSPTKAGLNILNQLAKSIALVNVAEILSAAKEQPSQLHKEYEERKSIFVEVKNALLKYTKTIEKKPLYILVDELDRARPDYAVHFLEVLKHFFDVQGIVFILGVDKGQIQSSVQSLYGQGLNFDEYYRKFVQKNIGLPMPNEESFKKYTEEKLRKFHENLGDETFKWEDYHFDNLIELIVGFDLSPRQINEVLRASNYFLKIPTQQKPLFGYFIAILIYCVISVKDSTMLEKLRKRQVSYEDMINIFQEAELIESTYSPNKIQSTFWPHMLFSIFTSEKENSDNVILYIKNHYAPENQNMQIGSPIYNDVNDFLKRSSAKLIGDYGQFSNISVFNRIVKKMDACGILFN